MTSTSKAIDHNTLSRLAEEEDSKFLEWLVLEVNQPIGKFYITSIDYKDLLEICNFDIREKTSGKVEDYIGIQRKTNLSRVSEISEFVKLPDASFPTSIIIAIDEPYVDLEKLQKTGKLKISNKSFDRDFANTPYKNLARVLDGQHRLKGLAQSKIDRFDVNVTIFVGMDIADQAMIFANVNLSQTKVNPSLAYDLQSLSKYQSPLRFAHRIVVALNKSEKSPFYRLIKRLGTKTPGVKGETLSQAVFVNSIIQHITPRDRLLEDIKHGKENTKSRLWSRSKAPHIPDADMTHVLREFYIGENGEIKVANLLINYFDAVRERWNGAWNNKNVGWVIKRTNGFKALMRFFSYAYLHLSNTPNDIITKVEFLSLLEQLDVKDKIFHTDQAHPGQGGENYILNALTEAYDKIK